jgi:hypothetical protein
MAKDRLIHPVVESAKPASVAIAQRAGVHPSKADKGFFSYLWGIVASFDCLHVVGYQQANRIVENDRGFMEN